MLNVIRTLFFHNKYYKICYKISSVPMKWTVDIDAEWNLASRPPLTMAHSRTAAHGAMTEVEKTNSESALQELRYTFVCSPAV
jgi:hypothetical protein